MTVAPKVDLDFQRYVERRKGAREAMTREGAAYAYAGDLRVLRTLDRLRPVRLALEATVRLWRGSARDELLSGAVKVNALTSPAVKAASARCAKALHVAEPTLYLAAAPPPGIATFGTNEEAVVLLDGALAERLTPEELVDAIGRELGRIQNNHVLYATALYYLEHHDSRFLRWVVSPAVLALRGWSRRAQITADRAGLLCTRDLDVSEAALTKLFPDPARVEALRLFGDAAYYRGLVGESGEAGAGAGVPLDAEQCDQRIAEVMRGARP